MNTTQTKAADQAENSRETQWQAIQALARVLVEMDLDGDEAPAEFDQALTSAMDASPDFKEKFFEDLDQAELCDDESHCELSLFSGQLTFFLADWFQSRPAIKRRLGLDRKRRLDLVEKRFLVRRSTWDQVKQTQPFAECVEELQIDHALRLLVADQEARSARHKRR